MLARDIEAIYRRHGHSVLRRARALMGSEDAARELLQDVFARLVDRPGEFHGQSGVCTWLYSVTTHAALNRLRDERTRRALLAQQPMPASETSRDEVERQVLLRQLLARLPGELAEVAVYRYLDGMTHDEIATVLDCSRRHVGDLLRRVHESIDGERS